MTKTFTVLTVSKRSGWYGIAERSIGKQSLLPSEWIIIPENDAEYTNKYLDGWNIYIEKAPPQTRLSNLNAALNAGLRLIKTDYVIFYQDFIELEGDCFEKLLALANEKTFVTTCTPNYDGSDDGRYTGCNMPRNCRPEEWETNVAIAPMAIIKALGGFDEEYDNGWSWDNVNVAQRAAMLGAKFIIDESNRPKLYPHEMSSHETLPLNAQRHERIMKDIRDGVKPIKLGYLK